MDVAWLIDTLFIDILVTKNFVLDVFDTSLANACVEK